jgi:hypothetical protein
VTRPLQVRSIEPGSQADKAGVLLGWHIRMINDVPIPNDRNKALAERMPISANIGASSFQLLIRMIGSASEMVFPR